ncbi:MAG: DoxX family membrane protein [Candidatus Marinimicrobia bacterium]|nr:DoxX family membrane protein [Candidatus Neomarinimicrobiota bacterium]MDD9931703.1 DoxX family membrane protein [Candidatus Neomarinimicrobiota bacterium]
MTRYFKGPVVLIARLILGGVFIYASLDKIAQPAEFAKAIGNYHVVPFGLENLMALALPWLELIAGICLIAGIMVDGATIMVILMNIVFIFAISQALARGISIECGCFSVTTEGGDNIGIQTILRDIGYLVLAAVIWHRQEKQLEFFPKSV